MTLVELSNIYYRRFHQRSFRIVSGKALLLLVFLATFLFFLWQASFQDAKIARGVAFFGCILFEALFIVMLYYDSTSENENIIKRYNKKNSTNFRTIYSCKMHYIKNKFSNKQSEYIANICTELDQIKQSKISEDKNGNVLWLIFPFDNKDRFVTFLTCLIAIIAAVIIVGGQSLFDFFDFYGNFENYFAFNMLLAIVIITPIFVCLCSINFIRSFFAHLAAMRNKRRYAIYIAPIDFLRADLHRYLAAHMKRDFK